MTGPVTRDRWRDPAALAGLLVILALVFLVVTRETVDTAVIGTMGALGTVLLGVPLTRPGGK